MVQAVVALAGALTACSQTPVVKMPELPTATAYREMGPWVTAQPADQLPRGAWWTLYQSPELNALELRLNANSPDLTAALARYQQGKALTDQIRSAQYPTVALGANSQRDLQSTHRPLRVLGPLSPNEYGQDTLGLDVEYEFDLWGRVRNLVAAGLANDLAAQADLESARLSLQTQLADSYFALRGVDQDLALLTQTQSAYAKALALTQRRHDAGISSGLDVARAQTQLESVRSQAQQAAVQRALLEHAIAALIGESASDFHLAASTAPTATPLLGVGLPSGLLQRRPDIAAAQRRVQAANASIGVAKAAYFPQITLSALLGYQSNTLANVVQAPNTYWSIGPSLFISLFDAGRREAEVNRVKAVLDEASAKYRSTVLNAFGQVEDGLAQLQHFGDARQSESAAEAAAKRSLDMSHARYERGAASYLEVVASQEAHLQAQRSVLDLSTKQLRASVQLVKALGGGWAEGEAPGP